VSAADIHFLVPGDPATPTGGFIYDKHAIDGLKAAGRLARVIRIDGRYPAADSTAIEATALALQTVPDGHGVIIDGLGFTALAPAIADHAHRLTVLPLVHHPLGDETGLSADDRTRWLSAEIEALRLADAILVTSETTKRRLGDLGVPADQVTAVPPGVGAAADLSFRKARPPGPIRLLCVATLIPRKGQHLLVDALADLSDRGWVLDLVGQPRDPAYAGSLSERIERAGLRERVAVRGAVSEAALEDYWRRADAFVFPSLHEGWGIAPVEAVRWGLPVICSDAGALPESVPVSARVMVPADDVAALRTALARLLDDDAHRSDLADGAASAAATLRTWDDMRQDFVDTVARLT
jgi:glycosyltransferase involved in cell wall biosynthesis